MSNERLVAVNVGRRELLVLAEDWGLPQENHLRYSTLFLAQLVQGAASRTLHVHCIFDVLRSIASGQRQPNTKEDGQFQNPPLAALWKAHFVQPSFIACNIRQHWNGEKGTRRLDRVVQRVSNEHIGEFVEGGLGNHIAHEFIVGAYEARARSRALTGEWIIYNKCTQDIDVLSFASHSESDDEIHARLSEFCGPNLDDIEW